MSSPVADSFAAELLQQGSQGLAGYAATLHLERRQGGLIPDDSFAAWKAHLAQRVIELGAALRAGSPELFVARVRWAAKAFDARGGDPDEFGQSLVALRDILAERLPAAAREQPVHYLERATTALRTRSDEQEPGLDPAKPRHRLALRFLEQVLSGDVDRAIGDLLAEIDAGRLDHEAAYLEVLLPAEHEIGSLWHVARASVAEEHLVTHAIQRCMVILSARAPVAPSTGRTAVFAAVANNAHDMGLRAAAELYRMAGWRTIFLGADVPVPDLVTALDHFEADVLLLGATLAQQLVRVADTIRAIRQVNSRTVIIVGGAAFDDSPEVWRSSGADAYLPDLASAVALGTRLTAGA